MMQREGIRRLALVPVFWVLVAVGLISISILVSVSGCTLFQPQQRWDPQAPLSRLELAWDGTVAARQWSQELLYALWNRDKAGAVSAAGKVADFIDQARALLDEAFAKFEQQGEKVSKRERDAYDLLQQAAQVNSKILLHLNTSTQPDWVWLIEQAKLDLSDLEQADTKLEWAIKKRSKG